MCQKVQKKQQVQRDSVEVGNTPLETGHFAIVLNLSELLDLLLENKRQIKKDRMNMPVLCWLTERPEDSILMKFSVFFCLPCLQIGLKPFKKNVSTHFLKCAQLLEMSSAGLCSRGEFIGTTVNSITA